MLLEAASCQPPGRQRLREGRAAKGSQVLSWAVAFHRHLCHRARVRIPANRAGMWLLELLGENRCHADTAEGQGCLTGAVLRVSDSHRSTPKSWGLG